MADGGKVILPSSPAFGRGIQSKLLPEEQGGFVHMETPFSGTFHFYTAEGSGMLHKKNFSSLPLLREFIQDYANARSDARRYVVR